MFQKAKSFLARFRVFLREKLRQRAEKKVKNEIEIKGEREKMNKERIILRVFEIVLIGLVVFGFFCFTIITRNELLFGALGIISLATPAILFIAGLKRIRPEERVVTEVFGKFHKIYKPGLHWICPFLVTIRAIVSIWEQVLPLFEGEKPEEKKEPLPKIDFKNGSATPRKARAFLKIKDTEDDIFRVVFGVRNWRVAAITLLGNALRSYLNGLTIEEGLEQGKAGYDFIEAIGKADGTKKDGIIKALNNWGLEILRVTIEDFDLDKSVIDAREEVLRAERKKAAAQFEVSQKALLSGGVHAEIVKILREKNYTKRDAGKVASDYVKYFEGVRTGRILDLRFSGGESSSLAAEIAKAVVAIGAARDLLKSTPSKEKENKENEKKKTGRKLKPEEEKEGDETDKGETTE